MVFIWRSGGGRRRRGFGPGYGGAGTAPGTGRDTGTGPGTATARGYGGGGGSCLRDLLLLDAGCCLAEMIGCGNNLFLRGPVARCGTCTPRAPRRTAGWPTG